MIMIFRCQDVSLALCVLMCTSKTLQLTASALGERKERERRQAGEKGRRRLVIRRRQTGPPPSIFLLANKWRVGDKVLEDKLQVKRCLTPWRGDTG